MYRIQTFFVCVFLLLIGNILLYSNATGASANPLAAIEVDKKSRELSDRTEDTGDESVF
jgi:hypothetical protein